MRKHSFEVNKCWLQVCSKGTEQFRPRGKEKLLSFWAWCWQTPSCCQSGSVSPCSWWGHWIRAPWWHCSSSVQRWMWLVWIEPLLWVQPLNAIDHHHCVCIQVPKSAPAGMFWAISTCLNISPHQMLWFSAFIYLLSLNKLLFFFFLRHSQIWVFSLPVNIHPKTGIKSTVPEYPVLWDRTSSGSEPWSHGMY